MSNQHKSNIKINKSNVTNNTGKELIQKEYQQLLGFLWRPWRTLALEKQAWRIPSTLKWLKWLKRFSGEFMTFPWEFHFLFLKIYHKDRILWIETNQRQGWHQDSLRLQCADHKCALAGDKKEIFWYPCAWFLVYPWRHLFRLWLGTALTWRGQEMRA